MEIKGKVFLFFEQSATFRDEFRKLGYEAEDIDIQNSFGKTDRQMDLFEAIEDAYDGKPSVWDEVTPDSLVMAFFPCIYFCANSQMQMSFTERNYVNLTTKQKADAILERSKNREYFFSLAVKMFAIAEERGIRLIMENPWSAQTFLKSNFVTPPHLYRQRPLAAW